MGHVEVSLAGGATVVLGYAGLTLVTDPAFDGAGERGELTRLADPAFGPEHIGHVHVVLLSHDGPADHLDASGRALLGAAGHVFSTPAVARRILGVVGLPPWHCVTVFGAHAPVQVTAVPAGPVGGRNHDDAATGFVLRAEGWPTVYVSGDSPALDVAAQVAHRFPDVGIAIVSAGAARAPGAPGALTVDAGGVAALAELWPAATVIPVHLDDWAHVSEPRPALRAALADHPARARIVLLDKGAAVRLPRAREAAAALAGR